MTDIQAGSLGGINPSEDLEQHDDAATDAELAKLSGQDGAGEPATPVEERDEPEPDPTPAGKKPSSPARLYKVLRQDSFDDGEETWTPIGEVESRNAQNALRKAARELRAKLGDSAIIQVVPKTMWRPTPVTLTVDERVSVAIG